MKKTILHFFAALMLASALSLSAIAVPPNSSHAVILMDASSGDLLFEQNADEKMLIASTTKILTALVILKNCDLSEKVEVSYEHASVEGSSMYLKPGGEYCVLDLLYGLMLASGNDAALALAEHAGGDMEGFVRMMNDEAASLGMTGCSFRNPHGLDADGHYGTARDLGKLTAEAMKNETFEKIVSTISHTVNGQTYVNHNKLLRTYDGTLGVKTGYTMAAGRSLVSCAERNGARLICVTISDPNDWKDHAALYDWGFSHYEQRELLSAGEFCRLQVISGLSAHVVVSAHNSLSASLLKDEVVTQKVNLPRFVYAPVHKDQKAGTVEFFVNERKIAEIELFFEETVTRDEEMRRSSFDRFLKGLQFMDRFGYNLRTSTTNYGLPLLV